ncbi:hypothetical protein ABZT48_33550 [Streptomyces avermitilis]|uniref:hypothetical protein n=1 Tax=Streptomyces avermitilis TaxID=33903 RepID=UPI0033BC1AD0
MVGEDRHAKVDQLRPIIGRSPLEAVELGHRSVRADLEPPDLAERVCPATDERAEGERIRRFADEAVLGPTE